MNRWFWVWLVRGTTGKPGYRHMVQWPWTPIDIVLGWAVQYVIPAGAGLEDSARILMLPLASIFIGLSFAWAGNAHTILQTAELEELAEYVDGGLEGIAWEFQLTVLVLLTVMVLWGFAGLGVFDATWPTSNRALFYNVVSTLLYASFCTTLRACWSVVANSQRLLIARARMRSELRHRGKLPPRPASGSQASQSSPADK